MEETFEAFHAMKKKSSPNIKSVPRATKVPKRHAYHARITVVGVGGAGGNALHRMRDSFRGRGIEFVAMNTDVQDLEQCGIRRAVYLGQSATRGLGAGMNPELGRQAAEESRNEIMESLRGSDLVFITAGLGGGTGSGAAPFIAEIAREMGALVVAVVTRPFSFEGSLRTQIATDALMKLREKVDTLIVVPNDRIFSVIKKETPLAKAFLAIDDVLRSAVQGIAELISLHGEINVDFADVRSIMQDAGSALVGIGLATGAERASKAFQSAITSPLLEVSIEGARGVLFAVAGGKDLKMSEINDIAKTLSSSVDPNAKIIFGAYHDRRLPKGTLKTIVIATGFISDGHKDRDHRQTLFTDRPQSPKGTPDNGNASTKSGTSRKESETPKKQEELWEVPAFIRKRKKA